MTQNQTKESFAGNKADYSATGVEHLMTDTIELWILNLRFLKLGKFTYIDKWMPSNQEERFSDLADF